MITFPTSIAEALAADGTLRAGATDLQERRHRGLHTGPVVDLRDLDGLDAITPTDGGVRIGALARVADVAQHPALALWACLQEAAAGLATPQIRNRATVGGNLLQEVRCWYFRHPDLVCAKKGAGICLARGGDHLFHVWDAHNGPCIAPHPSTLAVALLAYDATIELDGGERIGVPALLGDGSDPRQTHALPDGRMVVAVEVPRPPVGEGSAYIRAAHRARAEWPLVEVVARITRADGRVARAQVAVGAVRNRPVRLSALEGALTDAGPEDLGAAVMAGVPAQPGHPLPGTAYKSTIVQAAIEDALHRAWARSGSGGAP